MMVVMVVMMIRRRKSKVTHHSDAMRGHAEFIEMSVKNDRWWRSNLKIALINFRDKVSSTDFINLDLLGWEEAPEDKKMKVKE